LPDRSSSSALATLITGIPATSDGNVTSGRWLVGWAEPLAGGVEGCPGPLAVGDAVGIPEVLDGVASPAEEHEASRAATAASPRIRRMPSLLAVPADPMLRVPTD
jgi:hypothetical protein